MTMPLRYVHRLLVASALSLLAIAGCAPTDDVPPPFAWAEATDSLTIVGEGTVSRTGANVYGTAYTPGGDTLFFHTTDRGDGQSGIAMVTRTDMRTDTGWTAPRPAPFETDDHDEGHPFITPDGHYVLFASDRAGAPNNADEFYRASRASGWMDVTRMTTTERISEKRGGVASDGTMYYWTYTRGEGMGFYRGQIGSDGAIRDTVDADPLLFPNDGGENNPYIDPEKRFMLFAAWGREDGYGKEDLYLTTRKGDGWSAPVNLGPVVNSAGSDTHPYVTPDGERLFVTSTRLRSPADTSDNWNHYVVRTDAVPALRAALQ